MPRWFATDDGGTPFGPPFLAPDKWRARDFATALYGPRCHGAISVLEWEEVRGELAARERARGQRE
jgi:hypothetical protein